MKKTINRAYVEGYVYQHSIAEQTVKNQASKNFGKTYLAGDVNVAVDEQGLNVIPVHFGYVANPSTSTYKALQQIMAGKTWQDGGKEVATKVKISTSIELNEFYGRDDNLVSTMRLNGGFIDVVTAFEQEEAKRATFDADIVILKTVMVEANPEKNIENDYMKVRGVIFNYNNTKAMPVELSMRNPQGIAYFENLDASESNPVFTKVSGKIVNQSIKVTRTEESAWGPAEVITTPRKNRDWTITRCIKEPYDFGDESVLTMEDLVKFTQERNISLAELKKQSDDRKKAKAANNAVGSGPSSMTASIPAGGFHF